MRWRGKPIDEKRHARCWIILLTFAVLIAAGTSFSFLYRHFVTNRTDGGDGETRMQRDDKELLNSNGVKPARRLNGAFPYSFIWRMRSLCWPAGSRMRRAEKRRFGTGASSDPSH